MVARGKKQLGTLGSGNHFVEVCLDEAGAVWVVLHSGSRGIGNAIAEIFIDVAKGENEEELEDANTARLTGSSFTTYIGMMEWAQRYAATNRVFMMDAALADLARHAGEFEVVETINCHHNFAALEEHFGREVWVTRKGAIKADTGDLGIIPGVDGHVDVHRRGEGQPRFVQVERARSGQDVQPEQG